MLHLIKYKSKINYWNASALVAQLSYRFHKRYSANMLYISAFFYIIINYTHNLYFKVLKNF